MISARKACILLINQNNGNYEKINFLIDSLDFYIFFYIV